jgi:ribosomal protein S18 acetylase RimI-like enzyme
MTPIGGLAIRFPPGTELRPLARDDLRGALALATESRGLAAVATLDEPRRRFDRMLGDPDVVPLGVEAEDGLVGLAIVRFRHRLNYATFEGAISDLVVTPEYRGRGIGTALVEAAIAEWRLRGAHRLGVEVPTAADRARGLLAAHGFEDGLRDFSLKVRRVVADPIAGVTLREPRDEDGEAVTRLIAEFGPQRSPVPDRLEAVLRTFRGHLGDIARGRAASRVAELDGVVVGVATLEWQEPFWTDGVHAWLPDLVVTEPMRGRGIGRALLHSAITLSAERGADELRLESAPHRAAARALFISAGFVERGSTFILRRTD